MLCCTTSSQNTHETEERKVLYPWHPWAGRLVYVHDRIEKSGRTTFLCSLSGKAADRQQSIPSWMFERSADWLVGTAPVAGMAALVALAELLKAAADPQDSAARSTDSSAASGSDDTDRRQTHAAPTSSPPSIRSVRKRARDPGCSMSTLAEPAAGGPPIVDRVDGPPDPRSRCGRGRSLRSGGTP